MLFGMDQAKPAEMSTSQHTPPLAMPRMPDQHGSTANIAVVVRWGRVVEAFEDGRVVVTPEGLGTSEVTPMEATWARKEVKRFRLLRLSQKVPVWQPEATEVALTWRRR